MSSESFHSNTFFLLDSEKNLLKRFELPPQVSNLRIFLDPFYGWITETGRLSRERIRSFQGLSSRSKKPLCSLQIKGADLDENHLSIHGFTDTGHPLEIEKLNSGWRIESPNGEYFLSRSTESVFEPFLLESKLTEEGNLRRLFPLSVILICTLLFGFFIQQILQNSSEAISLDEKKMDVPIPVVMVPEKHQAQPEKVVEPEVVVPQTVVHDSTVKKQKAINQHLGFLKLLGKKEFQKAMGGLKTRETQNSAGAGAGGTEGSGGELLVGVGQGLRKTTVGNSGLKGLGGVGTKGAGGGAGGFGHSLFGSGAGGGALSTLPLSNQASVQGGLDRSVIQATILRYLSQIRACYEEGLKSDPEMIGQIMTDFEINAEGSLNYAKVTQSALRNASVESCIESRMIHWKFPRPRGGVHVKVKYPFMLRPLKS